MSVDVRRAVVRCDYLVPRTAAFIPPAPERRGMKPLHAQYQFLTAAREAVEEVDVDLAAVVRDGGAPVDRGVERVRRALVEGTVTPEGRWSTRAELLSYPVARVLVSLVDVPGAVEKYAGAEANLAYERFTDDFEADAQLKSSPDATISLEALLSDFDLAGGVEPTGDGRFAVDVGAYLRLSSSLDDGGWRLATRALGNGEVPVERRELYELLREAVRRRVADGLPLSVPDPISAPLDDEVAELRESLRAVEPTPEVDAVEPGSFPPCMQSLVEQVRTGEAATTGRFALLSFLASIGADFEQVATLAGGETPERLRAQFDRLAGESAQFLPPSCTTMQTTGDCVNPDELCETIGHPLSYYEKKL